MDIDSPIKKGHLLFPPQGVFSHIKKSWQKKYCELFRASKYGIERLEVFDSEEDAISNPSPRIITLENCIKVTADPQKLEANVFVVVTKTATHYFASVEDHEKGDWLSSFQYVAFKESAGGPIIEEDNELYCSSGEGVFFVKLVQSEASARCGLEAGPYTLLLTSSAIQLRDVGQQNLHAMWPYCFIRRYGYCDGKFTFEAGRMCDTGEGKFLVEHSNQQEIYRCLGLKMRNMRKLLEGDVSSAGQLQVALGMEARSRSPIPACPPHSGALRLRAASQGNLLEPQKPLISPTVETNPLVVINAPAHLKPRGLSASHGALDALSRKSPTLFHAKVVDIDLQPESGPPLQPKPAKPPRRPYMPEKLHYWSKSCRTLGKVADADYDDVEVREDAWRTLGVDDPAHSEDYEPVEAVESTRSTRDANPPPPVLPPPITRPKFLPVKPSLEMGNYDTLQYFGSGKGSSRSTYKQIVLSSTLPDSPVSPSKSPLTFHDYDEVAEPPPRLPDDVHPTFDQANRSSDDSPSGYGTIRRLPEHKLYNNSEYAVVTRPRCIGSYLCD